MIHAIHDFIMHPVTLGGISFICLCYIVRQAHTSEGPR